MRQPLTETEIVSLRGLGDRLDLDEVREVYLPLSRLLSLYAGATRRIGADTSAFLQENDSTTPFVVGVAGSVAVGKSTIARLLRDRHGFGGELRAVGDVLRDQLLYMKRCGFDAYELKEGKDIEGALEAFSELTVAYQGQAGDSRALFRRRD